MGDDKTLSNKNMTLVNVKYFQFNLASTWMHPHRWRPFELSDLLYSDFQNNSDKHMTESFSFLLFTLILIGFRIRTMQKKTLGYQITQSVNAQPRVSVTPQGASRERIQHMSSFKALLWPDMWLVSSLLNFFNNDDDHYYEQLTTCHVLSLHQALGQVFYPLTV